MNSRLLNFFRSKQGGVFEQAAEFLLADVVMGPLAGGQIFESLVLDFQSFHMDNLKISIALVPNLTLQQFHRGTLGIAEWESKCQCDNGPRQLKLGELDNVDYFKACRFFTSASVAQLVAGGRDRCA
ncbi:MAG: hypothetical protein JWQ04_2999 [Pedosphaera sp.]|nr:hypothetical protein [Pedosphaera sp.]